MCRMNTIDVSLIWQERSISRPRNDQARAASSLLKAG
jgi:hypothetical protein